MTYKTFNVGDVLTAADVQNIIDQTLIRVANAAERDGIAPKAGMRVIRDDTGATERHTGAAWIDTSAGVLSALTRNAQSIPNGTWTGLTFGGAAPDTNVITSGVPLASFDPNTGTVTVNAGVYRVTANVTFNAGGTSAVRALGIFLNEENNVAYASNLFQTNVLCSLQITTIMRLNTGDKIRARAYQGSGGAIATAVSGYATQLIVERLPQ